MGEDYGFNLGNVFGNNGHQKKGKKGKSKDPFGVSSLDNNFLSYVKSGNSDGGMGGFTDYINYGNEKVERGRRDDFFAYIPDIGSGYKDRDSVEEFGHDIGRSERSIAKANKSTVESYHKHKEKVEKEREDATERKKAKKLFEQNLSSAKERQDRQRAEEHEKRMKEKEMIEGKRKEKNMSTFNDNLRTKMVQRDDRYSGKGQVLDSDKEDLR